MKCKSQLCFVHSLVIVFSVTDLLTSVSGRRDTRYSQTKARNSDNDGLNGVVGLEGQRNEIRDERHHHAPINLLQREMRKEQQMEREMLRALNGDLRPVRTRTQPTVTAHLIHSINPVSEDCQVLGVATRRNKLYASCAFRQSLEIYDASTFSLERLMNSSDLWCAYDMASCPDCEFIYIADFCNGKILVVDDDGVRESWRLDDNPSSLSVNSLSNVIAVFTRSGKLREYTPSGQVAREITLQTGVRFPKHAVQLDSDRFAVSDVDQSQQRVCVVNGNGVAVQCYGHGQGSGHGQLNEPRRLALFGESLLVADTDNYRVLLLSGASTLNYTRELVNTRTEGCRPHRLAVNQQEARLYVAFREKLCPVNVYNLIID